MDKDLLSRHNMAVPYALVIDNREAVGYRPNMELTERRGKEEGGRGGRGRKKGQRH